MKRMDLTAAQRTGTGKGAARRLRRMGKIPGVLYGSGRSMPLTLSPVEVGKVFHGGAWESTLINLKVQAEDGTEETRLAILREVQLDPITDDLIHADLYEVSVDRPIRVSVPIEVVGETSLAVKEGGVLQHLIRDVEIECLPTDIPDRLEIDASGLKIGESIHIRDLSVPKGTRILTPLDQTVVSLVAPTAEVEVAAPAAAPAAEAPEPEVVSRSKKEKEENA